MNFKVCSDANAFLRLGEGTAGKDHICCPCSLCTVWFISGASRRISSHLLLGSQSEGPMGRWKLEPSKISSLWRSPLRTSLCQTENVLTLFHTLAHPPPPLSCAWNSSIQSHNMHLSEVTLAAGSPRDSRVPPHGSACISKH